MKTALAPICAALAALALSLPGAAQEIESRTVILKERPESADHVITLGDLFEDAGEAADAVVARAPGLGSRISLDPVFIQREAARNGLNWNNALGRERVTVSRAAREISGQALMEMVSDAIYAETGKPHEVALSGSGATLHAPLDSAGGPELTGLDFDPRGGQFRAQIAAFPGGEPQTVSGRAHTVADVPVLTRQISRGEIIQAGDIEWERLRADRVRSGAILSEEALIGKEARRTLRPGEPLRQYDVDAPNAVSRGETISLVYQAGGMMLTARAESLQDAAEGETARFKNLQSNRTIEAVVDAPGRARVTSGGSGPFRTASG